VQVRPERAIARSICAVSLPALLAACSAGATMSAPSTTRPPFTHSQVLGWVSANIENGASFISSISDGVAIQQLVSDSRPLVAAATDSLSELSEIPWAGPLSLDERRLVAAVIGLRTLTSRPPGSAYPSQLTAAVHLVTEDIGVLNKRLGS